MSFRPRRSVAAAAVLVLATTFTLGACGDDDDGDSITNEIGDSVQDGADNVEEGAEEGADKVEDGADEVEDSVQNDDEE